MNQHFEILIDASGSMGYMNGAGEEHENKYLLPDGKTTRTELVKKILINSIIPKLSFLETITVSTFRNEFDVDKHGKRIIIDKKYKDHPEKKLFYDGFYDSKMINQIISKIENPEPGATPLFWALSIIINQKEKDNFNIIVLSDGDANDREQFDDEVLKQIQQENKKCKIYFIGIDQDEDAQKKSKNLADKTKGFYVNLDIINYDEKIFESMLFELSTSITSNALKEGFKSEAPLLNKPREVKANESKDPIIEVEENSVSNEVEEVRILENAVKEIVESEIEIPEPTDLKTQVEENTKSLKLITSQLDSIVKEISFIRKGRSNDEDEFTANEDEELNRTIGYNCEKYLHSHFLKENWEKVEWLNETSESGLPYDFKIVDKKVTYFIECKGTTSDTKEFFLTKREWLFYLQNRKYYRLYFVYDLTKEGIVYIRIEDLLKDMEEGKLIPCSSINRKVKADRILFQIIN